MKLDKDQARVIAAAVKAGAISKAQRAELVRIAASFGDLSPRTLGLAVAVLRSGGLEEAERRAGPETRAELSRVRSSVDEWCSTVETRAVPTCTRDGRRTDNACAPKAARFDLAGVGGWLGGRTEIVVEDATGLVRLPARWALLPVGALLTSHDPLARFAPRPGYPPQLQERDYERGETEQAKVRAAAGNLYAELLLSDNRDALTGAPIVDRQRRVLGGNGRAMALALHLAEAGKDNRYAPALARELRCNTCFGLFGAPLSWDLVLVRVLDRVDDVLAISRQLNAPLSAAMTRETEAFSLGQRLSDRTIGRIGDALADDETASEAIDRLGRELVRDLISDGVITPTQRPAWLQTLGGEVAEKLNRSGKERVIDAIVALSVRDVRVIRDAGPSVAQLLAQLAPVVIRFDRWDPANLAGYNWAPAYRRALPYLVATQDFARDLALLRAYWGTRQLFDEGPGVGLSADTLKQDPEALCCYWWLLSLLGRPKVAAERARRTWIKVPRELRGEKGLYELRDRLEIAEQNEDPWSVRELAGWPSQVAVLDLGANAAIGELTAKRIEIGDWDRAVAAFNNEIDERPSARAIRARLIDSWRPQVVPLRSLSKRAEEERAALVESLRPVEAIDFELSPFEPPPRRSAQARPAREAKPWAELRAAGLSLSVAKMLAELGYRDAPSVRAVLEQGQPIEGFGKARRAKLRVALGLGPEQAPERKPRAKREKLTGGRADAIPDQAFDAVELARGEAHEREHTSDRQVAREIAKDHLAERPDYYDRLEEIEAKPSEDERFKRAEQILEAIDPVNANELRRLRMLYKEAKKQSEAWSLRRFELSPGTSRSRVTTINAEWKRWAEERDRVGAQFEALIADAERRAGEPQQPQSFADRELAGLLKYKGEVHPTEAGQFVKEGIKERYFNKGIAAPLDELATYFRAWGFEPVLEDGALKVTATGEDSRAAQVVIGDDSTFGPFVVEVFDFLPWVIFDHPPRSAEELDALRHALQFGSTIDAPYLASWARDLAEVQQQVLRGTDEKQHKAAIKRLREDAARIYRARPQLEPLFALILARLKQPQEVARARLLGLAADAERKGAAGAAASFRARASETGTSYANETQIKREIDKEEARESGWNGAHLESLKLNREESFRSLLEALEAEKEATRNEAPDYYQRVAEREDIDRRFRELSRRELNEAQRGGPGLALAIKKAQDEEKQRIDDEIGYLQGIENSRRERDRELLEEADRAYRQSPRIDPPQPFGSTEQARRFYSLGSYYRALYRKLATEIAQLFRSGQALKASRLIGLKLEPVRAKILQTDAGYIWAEEREAIQNNTKDDARPIVAAAIELVRLRGDTLAIADQEIRDAKRENEQRIVRSLETTIEPETSPPIDRETELRLARQNPVSWEKAHHRIMDELERRGWKVSARTLKTPWAESPNGRRRFWFKSQAILQSEPPHNLGDARSTYMSDQRTLPADEVLRRLIPETELSELETPRAAPAPAAADRSSEGRVKVLVKSDDRQSNAGWYRSGKQSWWIKGRDAFEQIPRVRGDKEFSAELWLEPGAYILGVGRSGKDAIRQTIQVGDEPSEAPTLQRQPRGAGRSSSGGLSLTCPTCKRPGALTRYQASQGHQCDRCADRDEGAYAS